MWNSLNTFLSTNVMYNSTIWFAQKTSCGCLSLWLKPDAFSISQCLRVRPDVSAKERHGVSNLESASEGSRSSREPRTTAKWWRRKETSRKAATSLWDKYSLQHRSPKVVERETASGWGREDWMEVEVGHNSPRHKWGGQRLQSSQRQLSEAEKREVQQSSTAAENNACAQIWGFLCSHTGISKNVKCYFYIANCANHANESALTHEWPFIMF